MWWISTTTVSYKDVVINSKYKIKEITNFKYDFSPVITLFIFQIGICKAPMFIKETLSFNQHFLFFRGFKLNKAKKLTSIHLWISIERSV